MSSVNFFIDLLHLIIAETWHITSILTKYLLAGSAVYLLSKNSFSKENYTEIILENGKDFLFIVTGLGMMAVAFGLRPRPLAPFASQLIAVIYLGYLFWAY